MTHILPPSDPLERAKAVTKLTRLQNGAKFEFHSFLSNGRIRGRYLDLAGEWCNQLWSNDGKIPNRDFSELDLEWSSVV